MPYHAGLDVSNQSTNICIVDSQHKVIFETVCPTEPEPIAEALHPYRNQLKHVGLEAGSLSFWLVSELRLCNLPAICLDSRQVANVLSTVINKTDKNDARGIAKVLAAGFYTIVHQKSGQSIQVGLLMRARAGLVADKTTKKNRIRGLLKAYGIRLKTSGHQSFIDAVRREIEFLDPSVNETLTTILNDYAACEDAIKALNHQVDQVARKIPVAKLLQSVSGVGPITALSFIAEIDDPKRFASSPRDVGAYLGLTPKQYSSGESTRLGGISKAGSSHMRTLLYEAAVVLLTSCKKWSKLKAQGVRLQRRMPFKKAAIAVARQLAVVMIRIWQTGEPFRFSDRPPKEAKTPQQISPISSKQAGSTVSCPRSGIKAKPSGLATRGLDPHSVCPA